MPVILLAHYTKTSPARPAILNGVHTNPMFVICPVTFDLADAEWCEDIDEAKEEALDWSAELDGRTVIIYDALQDEDGAFKFKPLSSVFA